MSSRYGERNDPEISGNDVADAIEDARHKSREEAVRRACEVMGWDYRQAPVWAGLRKVAMADAVAISVEKLNLLVDAIHEANRKANAARTLNSNQRQMVHQAEIEKGALQIRIDDAVVTLNHIADLLADSEDLPVGQTAAVRLLNEAIEALAGAPRK